MKKQLENTTAPISNQSTGKLTVVVNQAMPTVQPKTFTAVDMWNIQRRGVTMYQRRNCA